MSLHLASMAVKMKKSYLGNKSYLEKPESTECPKVNFHSIGSAEVLDITESFLGKK